MVSAQIPSFDSNNIVGVDNNSGRNIMGCKEVTLITANTVDAGDTVNFDLADVGGSKMIGFLGYKQTTDDSVIVEEIVTSSVTGTVVTFTIPAGTDNNPRIITIYYE